MRLEQKKLEKYKKLEQTLLTIVSSCTKPIDQKPDKFGAGIIDINEKLKLEKRKEHRRVKSKSQDMSRHQQ